MKFGVSAWSAQKLLFSKKISLRRFIGFCEEKGVDGIELLDCFWTDEETLLEIKKYLDEIKIPVSCYSIGNDFVQKKLEDREKQVEYVKKGIDTAVMLQTENLRIFSGSSKEGIVYEQGKAWIIDSLKECASYAEEKGITMVLENHGLFAGKSIQVKEIIETVGSHALKANIDTGNFLLVGEKPFDAVKNLINHIGFVHFKDFKKVEDGKEVYTSIDGSKYQGTIIGEGEVPLKDIVDFLYDNGYTGYLSIEYEGIGDPLKETAQSIEFVKRLLR